jgi:hypothetical protein
MIDLLLELESHGLEILSRLRRTSGDLSSGTAKIRGSDVEELASRAKVLLAARNETALATLGKALFEAVLPGGLGQLWRESYALARGRRCPIRLRVSGLPEMPWELFHDGARCISTDPFSSVVRFLAEWEPDRPFAVAPPIRVLVTSASQSADRWDSAVVDAIGTWGNLAETPTIPHRLRLAELDAQFRHARNDGKPFHIWHHTGHGHLDAETEEFRLQLFPADEPNDFATVGQLCTLFGANRDLRIVSLSVCHAAASGGLAPALARLNVPVVVAFPTTIAQRGAHLFMRVLHEGLRTLPVEQAVSDARRSLMGLQLDLPYSASPLLFSRRTDWGPLVAKSLAPECKPIASDVSGGVGIRIGKMDGRDNTIVGTVGSTRPEQKISMDIEEFSGEGHLVAGAVAGFSELEILKRNARLRQIAGGSDV